MTIAATRMRELAELEGFDIELVTNDGTLVDPRTNGLPRYDFEKKAKGSWTVSDWKEARFRRIYAGYDCRVLMGDGRVAHGNTKLESVRASYEEQ